MLILKVSLTLLAVSMIDGELFDKLVCIFLCSKIDFLKLKTLQEYIARIVRGNSVPFGGIQVTFISHLACQNLLCLFCSACLVGLMWRLFPTTTSARQDL